jgi:anthranilate phosphoribosyltransferase
VGNAGVLKALGLPIDMEPKVAAEAVTRHGFAYLDIALYHPPVYRFLDMRQELGVRNVFHAIARLLNPARASSQVVGLSHPPHFEKTAEVLRMLGCRRALVVSGVEGDPELSIATLTRVLELRDDRIMPLSFASKDVEMPLGTQRDMAGFPSNQRGKEAELLRRILHNQIQGGPCNWVLINAALILYAAGKGATWASCVPLARRALEEGAAARKLEELAQEPVGMGVTGRTH